MLTNEQKEQLRFLRNLDKIIIPRNWTYWNHDTTYKPAEDKDPKKLSDNRCWDNIPTDSFIINREMSFASKIQRINQGLDYHGDPKIGYCNDANALPFEIRVLQPKEEKLPDIFNDEQECKTRGRWWCGLDDGRHPKLPGGEEVCVFASTQFDEASGEKVDIVYCVLARDLELVTKDIKKELIVNNNLKYNGNIKIVGKYAYELDEPTVLKKDNDFTRLHDTSLNINNTSNNMAMPAGYKLDYKKNYRKPQKKM